MERVALHRADERQRAAGASPGVLHHRLTGLKAPVPLGAFDHCERHAVSCRSPSGWPFELHPHLGHPGLDKALETHRRCVADPGECPSCRAICCHAVCFHAACLVGFVGFVAGGIGHSDGSGWSGGPSTGQWRRRPGGRDAATKTHETDRGGRGRDHRCDDERRPHRAGDLGGTDGRRQPGDDGDERERRQAGRAGDRC